MKCVFTCALAAMLLAGCVTFNPASSGMKVSDEAMASIRDNVDTKDTIAAKLGQPTRKTAKDGKDFWFYDFKVMDSNLKITEQETTSFEFNTNTGVLLSHYKGASPVATAAPAAATTSSQAVTTAEGDDWCKKSVYRQVSNPLSKEKLDAIYQKCVADCKARYDKYVNGDPLHKSYMDTTYKSCTTAYMPGGQLQSAEKTRERYGIQAPK